MVCGASGVMAAQAPNPRSVMNSGGNGLREDGRVTNRAAQNVVSSPRDDVRSNVTGRTNASNARSAARSATGNRAATKSVRSATSVNARSATIGATPVRNASGVARVASPARATAIFNDISKIGGGYAACREAYATCMDQFCANANDTYRRCYCSAKFTEFRDTELALDQAKTLLMQFEDNNLNAVDKTAAEVDAMYSATVGEAAIKKDTSGAQSILNEIGDLLSGKKKASSGNSSTSLGIMSLDFSTDIGDVWGDGGTSVFDTGTGVDLTSLEGEDLFKASNKQCLQMIVDQCENNAVLNMATSAYGILITQDCNLYEKKVNSQREAVKNTVRQAEKILREARLEEYRAHNSQDVNDCISRVKSAMTTDVACGANYKRCLDHTGAYVNQTTGEPIYTARLFKLGDLIKLDGSTSSDVLGQNPEFVKFLDSKKMHATQALDSCRDLSDIVWTEFKRSALIEISQAQEEKLEAVRTSCVSTMAECYDTQTGALRDFDATTAQASGAISAYAAKAMCQDKVTACAALYGNNGECKFDSDGKLTSKADDCGLTALLAFVDTVDNVRVAEGCATAIDNYVKDLCTPTAGNQGYPWNCRKMPISDVVSITDVSVETPAADIGNNFSKLVAKFAVDNCSNPTAAAEQRTFGALPVQTQNQVRKSIADVREQMEYLLMDACENLDGFWLDAGDKNGTDLAAFYTSVYGSSNNSSAESAGQWGRCVQNDTRVRCLSYNADEVAKDDGTDAAASGVVARYDASKDECILSEEWYKQRCAMLGNGYFEGGVCYVIPQQ